MRNCNDRDCEIRHYSKNRKAKRPGFEYRRNNRKRIGIENKIQVPPSISVVNN